MVRFLIGISIISMKYDQNSFPIDTYKQGPTDNV